MEMILQEILSNNDRIENHKAKRVLIIYHEELFFLGDTCIKFNELKVFRFLYTNAEIEINFAVDRYVGKYKAILQNNPYIDQVSNLPINEIDYINYDIVICIDYRENLILEAIKNKYFSQHTPANFKTAIYSLTNKCLRPNAESIVIFPENTSLYDTAKVVTENKPRELHISNEEREWAEKWLRNNGLQNDESLFIILDSASAREKMLNIKIYFDLLRYLLNKGKSQILIFDEKGMGKDLFYKEWLGEDYCKKIIFSKNLGLREDLCLLASPQTRLILGPCTGLMHCASGIYNYFVSQGMPGESVPAIITYTGEYPTPEKNARYWWSNSPLVNCVILKQYGNNREVLLLNDIGTDVNITDNLVPCNKYELSDLTALLRKSGI